MNKTFFNQKNLIKSKCKMSINYSNTYPKYFEYFTFILYIVGKETMLSCKTKMDSRYIGKVDTYIEFLEKNHI